MGENASNVYNQRYEKINGSIRDDVDVSASKMQRTMRTDAAITVDAVKVDRLQGQMQEIRRTVLRDLDAMMSEVMELKANASVVPSGNRKRPADISRIKSKDKLHDKVFLPRNSYLTDLFEINHFRSIYNIFVVMLFLLFLHTALYDYIETGTTHVGVKTIILSFGNISTTILIWILMTFSTFITYVGFSTWAHKRVTLTPKSLKIKVWDFLFLLASIVQQLVFIAIPAKVLVDINHPPASGLLILMEQVRMLMKMYAFIRSNTPRVLAHKVKDEDNKEESSCPGFTKFLYFLFAPTLVYRDEYPRTKEIKWKKVVTNCVEIGLAIFYVAFILERFIIPPFEKFGSRLFEPRAVILTIFSTFVPGIAMFLFGFYVILHCTQNAAAELLRFSDRLFYKDWWNCTSYDVYYRTWNIIVHDWLYTYIYKDAYEIIRSKLIATLIVFLVSAIFHEYIMTFSFHFFYPVLLFLFGGFGLSLVFITKRLPSISGNFLLWFNLITGNSVIFTLYAMEYYARAHCPPYEDPLSDLLLPRSWICHNIKSNVSTTVIN